MTKEKRKKECVAKLRLKGNRRLVCLKTPTGKT